MRQCRSKHRPRCCKSCNFRCEQIHELHRIIHLFRASSTIPAGTGEGGCDANARLQPVGVAITQTRRGLLPGIFQALNSSDFRQTSVLVATRNSCFVHAISLNPCLAFAGNVNRRAMSRAGHVRIVHSLLPQPLYVSREHQFCWRASGLHHRGGRRVTLVWRPNDSVQHSCLSPEMVVYLTLFGRFARRRRTKECLVVRLNEYAMKFQLVVRNSIMDVAPACCLECSETCWDAAEAERTSSGRTFCSTSSSALCSRSFKYTVQSVDGAVRPTSSPNSERRLQLQRETMQQDVASRDPRHQGVVRRQGD